ncbi:hypothetical protein IEO70_17295 [Bacillus sp. AGMB 02131]|uniref:Lipoprotein n=1 Tax=Peribacillus faecalis TaxID=2772559 RepID=A0A927HCX7_9BACI|nr:hypothetical protein [Peribacillus faecalis]MBD3110092.1 hypothetical protein [Peribacillus faecalis]
MNRIVAVFIVCSLLMGCGLGTSKVSEMASEIVPEASVVTIGETVKDKAVEEWKVLKTVFTNKISPSKQNEFVTYYENTEEGYTYLDIVIELTNLKEKDEISDQFLKVNIEYDGKDQYGTCATVEDPDGQEFDFANATAIEPEETRVLHYYASVPEKMENDGKPVKAIITCQEKVYELAIRE